MDYSFNTDVAVEVGVEAAVIFQNIAFWCKKNAANEKHFHDGNYWTYNSRRAWHDLFPFFTERKVSRLLQKLKEAGLIEVGNYNAIGYDRTLWYAVTPKGWKLLKQDVPPFLMVEKSATTPLDKNGKCNDQNCQLHGTELTNRLDENVPPIPDINTDINIAAKEQQPEETKKVVSLYENNIHPLKSVIERDKLLSLCDDYPLTWIESAREEAALSNGRSLAYIVKILERWERDGFKVDGRCKKQDAQPSQATVGRYGPDNRPPHIPSNWVWNNGGWEEPYED
jgi:DnaD/phage-associated family protein